ncbi:hypothetical protein SD304_14000 [Staphylococcus nepalensis]|nr:hypothetical protein [Staphylococcus nepalensis]
MGCQLAIFNKFNSKNMKNYFATVLTGLEEVLLEEINTKLSATQINKIDKGKVFLVLI